MKKLLLIAFLVSILGSQSTYSMEDTSDSSPRPFQKKLAEACFNQSLWITGGIHAAGLLLLKKIPSSPLPIFSSLISGHFLKTISHDYLSNLNYEHHKDRLCSTHCKNTSKGSYARKYPLTCALGQFTYRHPFIASAVLHSGRYYVKKPLDNFNMLSSACVVGGIFSISSHNFLTSRDIRHTLRSNHDYVSGLCRTDCKN